MQTDAGGLVDRDVGMERVLRSLLVASILPMKDAWRLSVSNKQEV